MLDEKFAIVSAILIVVGDLAYLTQTIKGKNKPNKVTWFFWAFAPLLAFAAQIDQKIFWPSLLTLSSGLVALFIFFASFRNKNANWKITKFDIICGGLALLGLILWQITKVGNIAIAFSILADGAAALPTIKKAYLVPETETWFTFFMDTISSIILLLTLKTWNFANTAFSLYLLISCGTLFLLIRFRIGEKISKIIN
ncbi:hypothetical protein HY024_03255 [Candidatus Curtissbacteria bacterium]|nr:hypothetical protein [Candidatus Curtissbacteria bacterium]